MSSETAANGTHSESGMTGITDPRDTDVLCGRGGAALRHPGNQTYRRLVNLNKGLYITCLKTEKLKISRSIVAAIREQNGRFLEKDGAKGSWYDIGDKKAIEKTSQALREGQPKLRQKIVEMGGGAQGTAALMEQQFGANGIYGNNAVAAQAQDAHLHQQHSLQQQNMRAGFDPAALAQQQMGVPGAQMGAAMAAAGMMHPGQQHVNVQAMRQQQQYQQQQQQQYRQHQQAQHHQQQMPHQPQHRMNRDMPPPQARQALHNEMMRLSMHGGDDDPQQPQSNGGHHRNSRGGGVDSMGLRPSLVKRGSGAAAQLGVEASSMSLMSNFSGFGDSAHQGAPYGGGSAGLGGSISSGGIGGSMFGMDSVASGGGVAKRGLGPSSHGHQDQYGYASSDVDRRRIFAKMKYSRPPSDRMSGRHLGGSSMHSTGDGMPDFHMVESQLSLYSNLSGMTGNESKRAMAPGVDLLGGAGSRHSIMSGLSRISDTSEVKDIFSDLSKTIGKIDKNSTRSIAMSEISGIDNYRGGDIGGDDSDSTPSFGEAEPRTAPSGPSGTMDFDVF